MVFLLINYSYNNILKRGVRIALRLKINDSLITGLRIIDSILSVGRGQRQLILGDRYTGKSSIYICCLLYNNNNWIFCVYGFGINLIFGIYIGINLNLSKLSYIILFLFNFIWFNLLIATHSSSSSLLSFFIPLIGISISERLRDRGINNLICFDDLSKHSKSYRQIKLIIGSIPTRDAFPSDISNIHAGLLERCGKLKYNYFSGSITSFPIIETINSDITEYIATNVISITDGQFYLSKNIFLNNIKPSINSGLSVSRVGSNSQCKLMKIVSLGIKNELTNLRIEESNNIKLNSINNIFYQEYLIVSTEIYTILFLFYYKNGINFKYKFILTLLTIILNYNYLTLAYILFLIKNQLNEINFKFITYYIISSLSLVSSTLIKLKSSLIISSLSLKSNYYYIT